MGGGDEQASPSSPLWVTGFSPAAPYYYYHHSQYVRSFSEVVPLRGGNKTGGWRSTLILRLPLSHSLSLAAASVYPSLSLTLSALYPSPSASSLSDRFFKMRK